MKPCLLPKMSIFNLRWGWEERDYSRKAIILNISVKGRGVYSREMINRRAAIIRGNTVQKEWDNVCKGHPQSTVNEYP